MKKQFYLEHLNDSDFKMSKLMFHQFYEQAANKRCEDVVYSQSLHTHSHIRLMLPGNIVFCGYARPKLLLIIKN